MVSENHLVTPKTARYYVLGNITPQTQCLWFALHGYGQAAADFVADNFSCLPSNRHVIVAPEALNRFYWNGFGGKPVANWMASADRLNEITDYITYLNALYQRVTQNLPDGCQPTINLLGFSQGAATLSRWFAAGQVQADKVIFWAGGLAHDLLWENAAPLFNKTQTYLFYGNEDPFITPENLHLQKQLLHLHKVNFTGVEFAGKHTIPAEVLVEHFGLDGTKP